MAKQKLTPTAMRMKAARDKKAAMTPIRRKKKAENQRKRRAAIKAGKNISGKDYDHKPDLLTAMLSVHLEDIVGHELQCIPEMAEM